MRHGHGRRAVTIFAAAVAAIACLAGCGSVQYVAAMRTAPEQPLGPQAGSRATATAAARHLLSALVLPAGTRPVPQGEVPSGLREPAQSRGATTVVTVHRLYRMPVKIQAAADFLKAHLPAGMTVIATGPGGNSAATMLALRAVPRRLPGGIYAIELVDTIVAGPGSSSLLKTDAAAIWYPARSRAEYLTAARFRAVRIAVGGGNGAAVTIRAQRLIAAFTGVLNGLHAAPLMAMKCPATMVSYQLTFQPAVAGQPEVVVRLGNCLGDAITVGGREQPALLDPADRVYLLARAILRPAMRISRPVPQLTPCPSLQLQTSQDTPCPAPANPGLPPVAS